MQFCLFQLQSEIIFLEIDLFDDIDQFINILTQSEDIIDAYMIVYIIFKVPFTNDVRYKLMKYIEYEKNSENVLIKASVE